MSRKGVIQVAITSRTEFILESLATRERRSLSSMASLLLDEALAARGLDAAPLPAPKHGQTKAPE